MHLRSGDRTIPLERVAVMGVLNVTPDSFSDGGLWLDPEAAIKHGLQMAAEGAAIVDVGGESTRPGADPVPDDEELRRVLPVVERLAEEGEVAISIDTRKPEVARRAVAAGATIVNDTLGEAAVDDRLYRVARDAGAAIVVMHSRGTPATMRSLTHYADVVADVREFLARRTEELVALGVEPDRIAIDPGIGFAKDPGQSMALIASLDRLCDLGFPVLVGASRKSFIGAVLDLPEEERLEGTLAATVLAVAKGARIVRVHDVEPTVRAVRMTETILAAGA